MHLSDIPRARFLGKVGGRRVHRFSVLVRSTIGEALIEVTARNADEAVNAIRDEWIADHGADAACTQVQTIGPAGGTVERYIGYETVIGHLVLSHPSTYQLPITRPGEYRQAL